MKNLVILGGGYGGMRIINRLTPHLPSDTKITLIDKVPYHCLKTEFYALAAGTISDQHIRVAFPEHSQVDIVYGEVININQEESKIILKEENEINFDDLIIGLGSEDNYHNVPGACEYTHSIQTIENARETYRHLNNLKPNSVVAVIGGGLSGVELAAELNESRPDLHVKLFDRGNIILSSFPDRLSKYVEKWFENHGIEIIRQSNITKVENNVLYNHDEPMTFDSIVWTAGIQPNKIVRNFDVEKDAQGKVILTPHHHLPTNEHIFVVGDCASLNHAPSGQLAEAQAEQIATVLIARWKGETLPDELPVIKLKGVLGSLGKKHGFGLVAEKTVTGRVPRLLKSGLLWKYKYHKG